MYLKPLPIILSERGCTIIGGGREGSLKKIVSPHSRLRSTTASIPGFKSFPLSRFGDWAGSITEEMNPNKDTYVMVRRRYNVCLVDEGLD